MGGGKKDMETGRKSVTGSYDPSGRKSRIPAAYPVTMLVDLQVYVVPREKWVLSRRLYRHNIVEEGISLGFVRVLPQLSIHNLRRELQLQLGPDVIPRDFIFIRAVGNIFIQLKPKQEIELKVKNFIPPFSQEPEIYLLEVLPNEDPRMISPLPLLLREDTPPHICHDLCHHSLARKTVQVIKRDSESPQPTTPFPPVSITPSITRYPLSPYSDSEYNDIFKQYQTDTGEITQSRVDLAERQAAYDYENEIFESPTPSPTILKSSEILKSPRTLSRQKPVSPTASFENEAFSRNSTSHSQDQITTESPSSADTVRTAIHVESIHRKSNNDISETNHSEMKHEKSEEGSIETENKTEHESEINEKTDIKLEENSSDNASENQSNIITQINVTVNVTAVDEETSESETSKEVSTDQNDPLSQTLSEIQIEKNGETVRDEKEEQVTLQKRNSNLISDLSDLCNTGESKTVLMENTEDIKQSDSNFDPKSSDLNNLHLENNNSTTITTHKTESDSKVLHHVESLNEKQLIEETEENGEKYTEIKLDNINENNTTKTFKIETSNEQDDFNVGLAKIIPIEILDKPEQTCTAPQNKGPQKSETETSEIETVPQKPHKPKPFRDPRKPALYPQRMTKTTIVRQALAREKRRVYVEERIQSYMKNTQATASQQGLKSTTPHFNDGFVEESLQTKHMANDSEKMETTSHQRSYNIQTNSRSIKIDPLQSLPDINAFHNYNTQRIPYEANLPPKTLSAISVIKPPPYSYSSSFAMANSNVSRSHSDMASRGTFDSEGSRNSGIYVDSNPESTSNFWKNVSEQGFFYSFRVRQSGTVQMIDKSVQTGEQPHSYVLDFSRKSNGSYFLKSSNPLPQTTNDMHLPPINRDKILRDVSETVQLRHDAELRRAELIQRANDLQTMVKEKRDKINRRHEFWHKKYIEESSMTRPMEAACNSLRSELNTVHRRLIAHLEGRDLPLRLRDGPSKKANYKIMAARLQHEIKELQQKAKSAKLRLESEIKLKEQAEREVRDIRNDLAHKKVVMSLARSQMGTIPATHPRGYDKYDSLVY